jgi:hypothetical protein
VEILQVIVVPVDPVLVAWLGHVLAKEGKVV